MRIATRSLAAGLAVAAALPLGAQVPKIFEPQAKRLQGPPLWISAAASLDDKKGLDLDLIDSDSLRNLVADERQRLGLTEQNLVSEMPVIAKIPLSECDVALDSRGGRESGPPAAQLKAFAKAKSILRGKIRSIDWGFSRGVPSSLLEVELTEVVKGDAPQSPFYVDYLVAHFRIGSLRFCNTNKGFEPQPGDQILLFDFVGTFDRTHRLYAPALDEIFFERPGGGFFLPPRIKNARDFRGLQSFDGLVSLLRSEIRVLSQPEGTQP
jgi:hypothetical protein